MTETQTLVSDTRWWGVSDTLDRGGRRAGRQTAPPAAPAVLWQSLRVLAHSLQCARARVPSMRSLSLHVLAALLRLFSQQSHSCAAMAVPMEKLGAFVMQTGETSPVNWHGRTLLVEAWTGNSGWSHGNQPYTCCSCTTFGCVANSSAPIGYADCSGCAGTCSKEQEKAWGSCAPEFFKVRDLKTLGKQVDVKIPGTEGFGFANAFVHGGRLWVYGTNGVNRSTSAVGNSATYVHVFSTDDPESGSGVWTQSRVLEMPAGYDVFNVDVAAVQDGVRKFVMSIEVNSLAGKPTGSWAVIFAGTSSATPDSGWALVDPPNNVVDLSRMTACPAVRWFDNWYYVATTTEGAPCLPGGWSGNTPSLCVIIYRSKNLTKGSWQLGNAGDPIVQPADVGVNSDRKVLAPFSPTVAQSAAIHGHAPQRAGNINDSDFDFCDAPELGGVFGLWAGIANQQSNPYFNIGGLAKVQPSDGKSASQIWLERFF